MPQSSSEENVQDELKEKLLERRKTMLAEAHAALGETSNALAALGEGRSDEALEALARATGKLELLVARDPTLALAPVDVELVKHDIYATPKAIREARKQAEQLLEDGKVQDARALLTGLASEIVIRVTNLPLATYPQAIKAISPLIDEGKIEEAREALRAALNTLVVTDQVIALPVLRARHMLAEAEGLMTEEASTESAVSEEGDSEPNEARLAELVRGARRQLEMAELLGYGGEKEHEALRQQMAELEKGIGADAETGGVFARLRSSLTGLQTSLLE